VSSLNESTTFVRLFRNKKSLCVERLQFDTRRCSVSVMMNLRICDDEFTTCMCILLELQMSS
jgi:hypothetical protein